MAYIMLYPHVWSFISWIDQSVQHIARTSITMYCKSQSITLRPIAGGLLVPLKVCTNNNDPTRTRQTGTPISAINIMTEEPTYKNVSQGLRTLVDQQPYLRDIPIYPTTALCVCVCQPLASTINSKKPPQITRNLMKIMNNCRGPSRPDASFSLVKSLFSSPKSREVTRVAPALSYPRLSMALDRPVKRDLAMSGEALGQWLAIGNYGEWML